MLIGFIGDMHGRVFHALAALATWQSQADRRCDLVIQVGDMGYPDLGRADEATRRYLAADPEEAGLGELLRADGARAAYLRHLRRQIAAPILCIRGNHEDFAWLDQLPVDPAGGTAPIDPFDLFRYVPDGTVRRFGDSRIAFLGGIEGQADAAAIDRAAYERLLALAPGTVDLLVTHQGPYGSSVGFRGDTHGSPLIARLLDHLRPPFQVAGHAHQLSGPRAFGQTTYLGLDCLVASPIWHPEARGLQPGCLGCLDTATAELVPVTDAWLADFPTPPFDFDAWAERFMPGLDPATLA